MLAYFYTGVVHFTLLPQTTSSLAIKPWIKLQTLAFRTSHKSRKTTFRRNGEARWTITSSNTNGTEFDLALLMECID